MSDIQKQIELAELMARIDELKYVDNLLGNIAGLHQNYTWKRLRHLEAKLNKKKNAHERL